MTRNNPGTVKQVRGYILCYTPGGRMHGRAGLPEQTADIRRATVSEQRELQASRSTAEQSVSQHEKDDRQYDTAHQIRKQHHDKHSYCCPEQRKTAYLFHGVTSE